MNGKDSLTQKQRLFVEYYLGKANGNATEAARLAGYSDKSVGYLRVIGHDTLMNPNVAEAIKRRVAEAAMEADEVLGRLADIARGSLAYFIEVTGEGAWKTNLKKGEEAGKLHLLQEIAWTEHGPKFKIHDPVGALTQLGRHHKLFTDRQEHSGTVRHELEEAAEEYDRRLHSRAARNGANGHSARSPVEVEGE